MSVRSPWALGTCALLLALSAVQARAQTPDVFFVTGRNVNTLGPTPPSPNTSLAGNPKHKQRNEDSCDVSPQNPWVVLCANNDYRGIEVFGDSWIGLSMSNDGARTWRDRLLDGFPTTPKGIGAADPVVRTVPGLGLVSYITLSRADGRGTLALALLLERNKENGEPYEFYQTRVIGTGTPGQFNDKPAMTTVLDPAGGTIDIRGRAIPKGTVHFAYSLFPGNDNNSSSQIYHTFSRDYGLTWSSPKKLSESLGINQGVDLAFDDATSTMIATWRQVADTNQGDSIAFARSTDGGQTWSKPKTLWTPLTAGMFFDQDTAGVQFRTRSMPSIVHDGAAFHIFWSARGFASSSRARAMDAPGALPHWSTTMQAGGTRSSRRLQLPAGASRSTGSTPATTSRAPSAVSLPTSGPIPPATRLRWTRHRPRRARRRILSIVSQGTSTRRRRPRRRPPARRP